MSLTQGTANMHSIFLKAASPLMASHRAARQISGYSAILSENCEREPEQEEMSAENTVTELPFSE